MLRSLPPDLTLEGKKEAMNLLKEKRDLEQMKQGKDSALVKKIDARLEAINVELDALTDNASTSAPAPTGTRRNRAQVLTEEEEKRRTTLEEAIANQNSNFLVQYSAKVSTLRKVGFISVYKHSSNAWPHSSAPR